MESSDEASIHKGNGQDKTKGQTKAKRGKQCGRRFKRTWIKQLGREEAGKRDEWIHNVSDNEF